jgi:hypothetical protein
MAMQRSEISPHQGLTPAARRILRLTGDRQLIRSPELAALITSAPNRRLSSSEPPPRYRMQALASIA